MKSILLIIFFLAPIMIFGQIPEKQKFYDAYYSGAKFHEAVESSNFSVLSEFEIDSIYLVNLIKSVNQLDSFQKSRIMKDIMYNKQSDKFEFIVYHGSPIDDNTSWGLMNYNFVYKCIIDLTVEGDKFAKIVSTKIFNTDSELKGWWQNYMSSYKKEKYDRSKIADKYGFVPPPPPPPKTKEWFDE